MIKMKQTKHDGVFLDGRRIYTVNKNPGKIVYGERLFKEGRIEYRQWDPKRSKLGAAIAKNVKLPKLNSEDVWLYLGASSGTTVSHVSDILDKGIVFALDFAPRVLRELYFLSIERKNIAPIFADANKTNSYAPLITGVDVLFQDIAQRDQVRIFLKNFKFLKKGGYAILSIKARSIDVTKKPSVIFKQVERELSQKTNLIEWKSLDPFERDHAIFICKKN